MRHQWVYTSNQRSMNSTEEQLEPEKDEEVEESGNQKVLGFFKKVFGGLWKWLKGNWLALLLVFAVAALFVRGCESDDAYNNLFQQYQEQSADHQRQIKELQTLQQQEREELDRQLQDYLENMNRIEREYKEEIQRIESSREVRRVTIIRETLRDPGTLTDTVTRTFGIPVE